MKDVNIFVALSVVVVALIVIITLAVKMSTKDKMIARLEATITECRLSEQDARAAIERQNAAIESVRVDTVVIEKLIKSAEKKYVEIREIITESTKEDSSHENQVNNIDFALRRFHGVELFPASGD